MMAALRAVVRNQGLFCAFSSDRASPFIHTPPAGQSRRQTQVERALAQLHIALIAAHPPQAGWARSRLRRAAIGAPWRTARRLLHEFPPTMVRLARAHLAPLKA